jgi:hypothetical protein
MHCSVIDDFTCPPQRSTCRQPVEPKLFCDADEISWNLLCRRVQLTFQKSSTFDWHMRESYSYRNPVYSSVSSFLASKHSSYGWPILAHTGSLDAVTCKVIILRLKFNNSDVRRSFIRFVPKSISWKLFMHKETCTFSYYRYAKNYYWRLWGS